MIAYFDHTLDSNLFQYSTSPLGGTYWTVAHDRGIAFRAGLAHYGHECRVTEDYTDPGYYIVEVNGGPALWTGHSYIDQRPTPNVLTLIPDRVIAGMQARRIKLLLLAWAEGHSFVRGGADSAVKTSMETDVYDAFSSIYQVADLRQIPLDQIIIVHGNQRCSSEYQQWCQQHGLKATLTLMPGYKFFNIFTPQSKFIEEPLINWAMVNSNAKAYNSLNRIIKAHRNDHFYELIRRGLLEHGCVSGNYHSNNYHSPAFTDSETWNQTVSQYFPRTVDINDFDMNPADNLNSEIYSTSLLTVITETHFNDDITFLSEKIFKPLSAGHPFLVLGNPGTLAAVRALGFRTDFAGIDTDYDNIQSGPERFQRVHSILEQWVNLSHQQRINLITKSLPVIYHNFEHYRRLDLHRDIFNALQ